MAKNQAEVQRYTVLRDSCEKPGHGWVFPETLTCAGTVTHNLYTGDYSLPGHYQDFTFVIERKKSMSELAANLSHKEKWDDFKNELERLEKFKHSFIICEFPISCFDTFPLNSGIPERIWPKLKVTPKFFMKRLQEIQLKFKTPFLFFDTPDLGMRYASGLFKRIIESYGHKTHP